MNVNYNWFLIYNRCSTTAAIKKQKPIIDNKITKTKPKTRKKNTANNRKCRELQCDEKTKRKINNNNNNKSNANKQ